MWTLIAPSLRDKIVYDSYSLIPYSCIDITIRGCVVGLLRGIGLESDMAAYVSDRQAFLCHCLEEK
jgi:hypothetical protein